MFVVDMGCDTIAQKVTYNFCRLLYLLSSQCYYVQATAYMNQHRLTVD